MVVVYGRKQFNRWSTTIREIVSEGKMSFSVLFYSARVDGKNVLLDSRGRFYRAEDLGSKNMTSAANVPANMALNLTLVANMHPGISFGLRRNGNELITGSQDYVFSIWNCNVARKRWCGDEESVENLSLTANGNVLSVCQETGTTIYGILKREGN